MQAKLVAIVFFSFLIALVSSQTPYGPNCVITFPEGMSGTAHATFPFVIRAVDASGNNITTGGSHFLAMLSPSASLTQLFDNGDGTYSGSFVSATAQSYSLDVTLQTVNSGTEIQGSPFSIVIGTAVVSAAGSTITLAESGVTNYLTTFVIQSATEDGTPFTVGGATYTVSITPSTSVVLNQPVDNHDGTYTGSFKTAVPGFYVVDVQLTNPGPATEIQNGPFTIQIFAQLPDAAHCTASGPGVSGGSHLLHPAPFTVVAKDVNGIALTTGGTSFVITIKHFNLNHPFSFVDNMNGTYSGSYIPIIPFGQFIVTIKLGGQNIMSSPFYPSFLL